MVSQNPVSFGIFKLIQTVISVTFTCTAAEKNQLLSVSVSVSVSIQMVTAEVNHIQDTLLSVTGSQASVEEIEASNLCASKEDCDSLIEIPEETTEATTITTTTTTTASNEKPVSMPITNTSTTVGNEKPFYSILIYAVASEKLMMTAFEALNQNIDISTVYTNLGDDAIIYELNETAMSLLVTSCELPPGQIFITDMFGFKLDVKIESDGSKMGDTSNIAPVAPTSKTLTLATSFNSSSSSACSSEFKKPPTPMLKVSAV